MLQREGLSSRTEADIRSGRWWARVGRPHLGSGEPKSASNSQHPFDLVYYEITWELTEWKEVPTEAILKFSNPVMRQEADIRSGRWWARVGKPHFEYGEPKSAGRLPNILFDLVYYEITWELTEWKEVPTEAILKFSNPTGSPVICHSTLFEIWCSFQTTNTNARALSSTRSSDRTWHWVIHSQNRFLSLDTMRAELAPFRAAVTAFSTPDRVIDVLQREVKSRDDPTVLTRIYARSSSKISFVEI